MALAGKTPLLLVLRCFCASYAAELLTQQLFWPAFPSPSEGRWMRNWFKDQKQERPVCASLKLMVKRAALNRYKYIWSWVGVSTRLFVLFTELFAEVSRVVGHCADHWLPLLLQLLFSPQVFACFLPDRCVCWEYSIIGEHSHGCRGCECSAWPLCQLVYFLSCSRAGTLNLEPSVTVSQWLLNTILKTGMR